jgi:hypothetical protein
MKIELAVATPEAEQFRDWLIAQGHDACVGNSTGNYIDGVLCGGRNDDDGEARAVLGALWEQYCNQPESDQ